MVCTTLTPSRRSPPQDGNGASAGLWTRLRRWLRGERELRSRTVPLAHVGAPAHDAAAAAERARFPPNVIRNQKYSVFSFVPLVLYAQFQMFFNLFFLGVAVTQFVPVLKVGFLFTYVAPLAFVLTITLLKEAYDDYNRYRRDKEVNSASYPRLTRTGIEHVPASELGVGDLVQIESKQRVPADMVLLRTTNRNGASFIKTDQLDGETDWKLRHAVAFTQALSSDNDLLALDGRLYADKPHMDIYKFVGTFSAKAADGETVTEALSLDQTMWSGTVVASGTVIGMVVYTGVETRAVMNTSQAPSKVGLLDLELNRLSKVLFVLLIALSAVMTLCKGLHAQWPLYFFRFLLLFSSVIPISLRVNLDMAKVISLFLFLFFVFVFVFCIFFVLFFFVSFFSSSFFSQFSFFLYLFVFHLLPNRLCIRF